MTLLTGVLLLPSQGNGQVEDREHHGPAVISEQVSDDGGRDGGVAGLSDTHESSGENKQPVVLRRQRKKRSRVSMCLINALLHNKTYSETPWCTCMYN